jgi:hypothetical protein
MHKPCQLTDGQIDIEYSLFYKFGKRRYEEPHSIMIQFTRERFFKGSCLKTPQLNAESMRNRRLSIQPFFSVVSGHPQKAAGSPVRDVGADNADPIYSMHVTLTGGRFARAANFARVSSVMFFSYTSQLKQSIPQGAIALIVSIFSSTDR